MLFKQRLGRIVKRSAAGIGALGALAALSACGGGTYQQQTFVPARILTFGDESSRLEGSQGLKYSINGISSTTLQIDCSSNLLWTQTLASSYGLVYSNCNTDANLYTNAIDYTTVDATVDDVVTSVDSFEATDTFNSNDLVTIWVGMHDVLGEYQANGSAEESVLTTTMEEQGAKLAAVVNSIAKAGAKVILLTIPDMQYSPYGYTESQRGDIDRLKLLSDMSTQFNVGLRSNILNDGSKIGLVLVDDLVRNAVLSPSSYSLISNDREYYGCLDSAPLPNCTVNTLRTDPATGETATSGFLWADSTHLGSILQGKIGSAAVSRAHSNPF